MLTESDKKFLRGRPLYAQKRLEDGCPKCGAIHLNSHEILDGIACEKGYECNCGKCDYEWVEIHKPFKTLEQLNNESRIRTQMAEDIAYDLDIETEKEEHKALLQLPTSLLLKLYRGLCEQSCGFVEDGYKCKVGIDPNSVCGIHGTQWKDPL